jgi:hypothetical protein
MAGKAQRRPGGGAAADSVLGDRAEKNSLPGADVKLSPIELATIFAPACSVPALLVHSGTVIMHYCPADVAAALPTSGQA